MDVVAILTMFIQACAAFWGAAWASKKYVAPVKKQIDDHEKKDFEFHAKVEAVLWPAQR
jgi:hypothetical protein